MRIVKSATVIAAFTLSLILSSSAHSQNYTMNIKMKDGMVSTHSLSGIRKIVFLNVNGAGDNSGEPAAESIVLKQNYPNPCNPTTVIEYQIPRSERVWLCIYDIHGKAVRELVDGIQNQGMHQVVWDGKDQRDEQVSSGVYLYTIRAGARQLTRKFVLSK